MFTPTLEINDLATGWDQAIDSLFSSAKKNLFARESEISITENGEPIDTALLIDNFRTLYDMERYHLVASNFRQVPRDFRFTASLELGYQNVGSLNKAETIIGDEGCESRIIIMALRQTLDQCEPDQYGYISMAPMVVLAFETESDCVYAKMKHM